MPAETNVYNPEITLLTVPEDVTNEAIVEGVGLYPFSSVSVEISGDGEGVDHLNGSNTTQTDVNGAFGVRVAFGPPPPGPPAQNCTVNVECSALSASATAYWDGVDFYNVMKT